MKESRGKQIAALRKARGMTQAELAEKMGVTDKAVSKWERDLSCPDVETLPKLAALLGISLEQLMQTEAPEPQKESIVPLICKAVALAMGVAVTVLSILGKIDLRSGLSLLGIGLAALALERLREA